VAERSPKWHCMLVASGWLCACGASAPPPRPTEPATGPLDVPSIVVTEEHGHPHVGDEAPDFELTDAQGETLRLSSMRGSIVVLAFVASWCPYSKAEQPHLAQTATEYAPRGVRFLTVSLDEDEDGYRRYVERMPMPMPVLHDPAAAHLTAFIPPRALPKVTRRRWKVLVTANLVVDPEGRIAFFTLPDLLHFDAELVHLRKAVDRLLAGGAT
jgi:peroxiredoxin